ncbi:MAG: conserved phage C-terminal domain-containing protein [bacterium]|nr:conserved phage C-terminal domain-containing protein [bacterium]
MSSWYRTIDAGIWGDEKFRRLSQNAKFLFLYLLTGDHTEGLPGLYRLGEAALAESLGWTIEELRAAFAELASLRMALADISARVVYLPNALKYQAPSNPNHLQGLGKAFRRIPECALKDTWLQQVTAWAQAKGERYAEALRAGFETVPETVADRVSPPNPNPQPNPKPYARNAALPGNGGDMPSTVEEIPFAEIVGLLNQRSGKRYRHGTEATKRHIRARWREGYRMPDFRAVIEAKCAEWSGSAMEKYLRPETLFGPKFEGYVNERPSASSAASSLYPDMDELMEASHAP